MVTVTWLAMSYLLGSLPFGLIIAKSACRVDPRKSGSGNIGATNVARLCGTGYGALTLFLDLLKGFMPVFLATTFSDSALFLSLTALATLLGHMYSVFLSGSGGKGVATTVGVFLALAPAPLLWAVAFCLLFIRASGFVSLGSLSLVTLLPLFLLLSGNFALIPLSLVVLGLIYWKHSENIIRLARGEEKTWKKTEAEQA